MALFCSPASTGLPINKTCPKSQNEMLKDALIFLSGDLRKAMKLLCRQYYVLEMLYYRNENVDFGRNHVTNSGMYSIRYIDRENPDEIFTWTIKPSEIKN